MKKIVFGGIYIISGLLSTFVFYYVYGITWSNDIGFINLLSIISILVGIYFTIKGLREKKENDDNDD